jgi:hypothetical protein
MLALMPNVAVTASHKVCDLLKFELSTHSVIHVKTSNILCKFCDVISHM